MDSCDIYGSSVLEGILDITASHGQLLQCKIVFQTLQNTNDINA